MSLVYGDAGIVIAIAGGYEQPAKRMIDRIQLVCGQTGSRHPYAPAGAVGRSAETPVCCKVAAL